MNWMKIVLFIGFLVQARGQSCEWLINGNASENIQNATTCIDRDGYTFLSFSFSGTVTFSGITYISRHAGDILVLKINPKGNILWVKQYQSRNRAPVNDIHLDNQGNIYITGTFMSGVTFGNSELTNPGYTGWQMYVAKLDPNGNALWAKQSTSSSEDVDVWGVSIIADENNAIYVAGGMDNYSGHVVPVDPKYHVTVEFGGAGQITEAVSGFVVKYNASNGTFIWNAKVDRNVLQVNGSNSRATYISGSSITRDNSGNLFTCFTSKFDILHHEAFQVQESHLVKLSPEGKVEKTIFIGPNEVNYGKVTFNSLSYSNNKLYGSGVFLVDYPINFNGIILDSIQPPVSTKIVGHLGESFFVEYNSSLMAQKVVTGGNPAINKINQCFIVANNAGKIFAAGSFHSDTLAFGGQIILNKAPENKTSVFASGYNGGKATPVFHAYSTSDQVRCYSVEAIGNSILLAGAYKGTADFGDKTVSSDQKDIFLAKINYTIDVSNGIRKLQPRSMKIYPNPTRQFIYVAEIEKDTEVKIFDASGKMVQNIKELKSAKIDISGIQSGVYFMSMQKPGKRTIKKIIVEQ